MDAANYFPRDFTVLAESDFFIAIPSAGSFVPGYVLIIPKKHHLSFRTLTETERTDYENFSTQIHNILVTNYGRTIIFEHGPKEADSALACGVNYAHMHLVPTNCLLIDSATDKYSYVQFRELTDFRDLLNTTDNVEYLYVFEDGKHYYTEVDGENIGSQYLRKIIAEFEDKLSEYDYNKHNFEENITETKKFFTKY